MVENFISKVELRTVDRLVKGSTTCSEGSKESVFNNKYWSSIKESGFPANSCYYWFLRNFRKRALANAYVDSAKPPTAHDFDCQTDEIMDASAMLRNRDGVLGYVSVG
ncbi:hypothetical protein C5167_040808 [Papaver somniferum]|uniref:Uncharacterized protein n=1 Tax=Papaver somniferum TaxID=3469 RepID=A0A4Y7IJJ0_PAPSO|nr:hypothetical protein C5167_040808 [Papaver somniferum]